MPSISENLFIPAPHGCCHHHQCCPGLELQAISTIYRLSNAGDVTTYLHLPGPTGRQLIELKPTGMPLLREHDALLVLLEINIPAAKAAGESSPSLSTH